MQRWYEMDWTCSQQISDEAKVDVKKVIYDAHCQALAVQKLIKLIEEDTNAKTD